ncbi:hypothetical protein E1J23_14370 [Xanthomonas gardneri]|nr:hypothetical protein [Xanthomonas hortorum pv. gardneri]NMI51069.1 hypothetical protein [Xanthomonas hortorum pv. taraxaci]
MASTTGEGMQSIVCNASLQREGSGNADFYRARRAASHDMQRYAVQPQRITSSPKSLPPPGEGARRADGGTVHTSTYPHTRSPQLCRNT